MHRLPGAHPPGPTRPPDQAAPISTTPGDLRQLTTTQEQNRLLALRMRQAAMAYRMAGMGSRGMAPMMGAGLNAGMGMASPALSGLGSGAGSLGQLGSV